MYNCNCDKCQGIIDEEPIVALGTCELCDDMICAGYTYYKFDGGLYCEDCIEDMSRSDIVALIGGEKVRGC